MVHRALLVSVTTFYGVSTLPGGASASRARVATPSRVVACFLCCISPMLMDDSAVMGIVGMGGPPGMMDDGYGGDFDMSRVPPASRLRRPALDAIPPVVSREQAMGDHMLLLGGVVCLWLYPMNVAFSLAFMWLCHAVWLCEKLWLPERVLIVLPLLHMLLFFAVCCAMACAYRERSKRRFQAAVDRARLFQEDPQAFFREKKFRKPAAEPAVVLPMV